MAARSKVVIVGWVLIGLIGICVFAVALIATFEGGGAVGVDSRVSGKPGTFTPVVYIPLLLAVVGVAIYWAWNRLRRRPTDAEPSNSTPHTDARDERSASQSSPGARAGGRGR
jgi:hypothetical protein